MLKGLRVFMRRGALWLVSVCTLVVVAHDVSVTSATAQSTAWHQAGFGGVGAPLQERAKASPEQLRYTSLNLCYDHLDTLGTLQPTHAHGGRIEAILNFAPDKVLANPFSDPFLIARLQAQQIDVVRLPEPASLAQVAEFYQRFDGLLDYEVAQWPQIWRDQGVLMLQANHYSFGEDTLWHEVVEALGGENLAPGSGLVTVLPEQVLALNPDVIVVLEQEGFALAGRNQLHGALTELLDERAVYIESDLVGCMAQRLDELVTVLTQRD